MRLENVGNQSGPYGPIVVKDGLKACRLPVPGYHSCRAAEFRV